MLATRFRLSPLIGYLCAGVILGPNLPFFYNANLQLANEISEVGVMLLMFGVGLHFSFSDLKAIKNIAGTGALLQISGSILVTTVLGHFLLGYSFFQAGVFGLAISIASTVVLLRSLDENQLAHTPRGKIAIGWLIVQDLFTVLALVILPTLTFAVSDKLFDLGAFGVSMLWTLVKLSMFTAAMLLVGRRVIPTAIARSAATGSRELFTLSTLAIAIGIAYLCAFLFDVSFALGAFFAGVILTESELAHRTADHTLPLRDAFAVLFFVSVGMLFDFKILYQQPIPVLVTVFIILFVNSGLSFVVVKLLGKPNRTALTVAVSLSQVGEFSFIISAQAVGFGYLLKEQMDYILAAAIISIVLNPFLFKGMEKALALRDVQRARLAEEQAKQQAKAAQEKTQAVQAHSREVLQAQQAQPTLNLAPNSPLATSQKDQPQAEPEIQESSQAVQELTEQESLAVLIKVNKVQASKAQASKSAPEQTTTEQATARTDLAVQAQPEFSFVSPLQELVDADDLSSQEEPSLVDELKTAARAIGFTSSDSAEQVDGVTVTPVLAQSTTAAEEGETVRTETTGATKASTKASATTSTTTSTTVATEAVAAGDNLDKLTSGAPEPNSQASLSAFAKEQARKVELGENSASDTASAFSNPATSVSSVSAVSTVGAFLASDTSSAVSTVGAAPASSSTSSVGEVPARTTRRSLLGPTLVSGAISVLPRSQDELEALLDTNNVSLQDPALQDNIVLTAHTIVVGYAEVGRYVVARLHQAGMACAVITNNLNEFYALNKEGLHAIFGDCRQMEVFKAAAVQTAQAIIFSMDKPYDVGYTVDKLYQQWPQLWENQEFQISAMASYEDEIEFLHNHHVDNVISLREIAAKSLFDSNYHPVKVKQAQAAHEQAPELPSWIKNANRRNKLLKLAQTKSTTVDSASGAD